jgi:3-deoxy-D-manno-octulosonate 8-phosphate phosphatase (KDO 8-P phosphatase)
MLTIFKLKEKASKIKLLLTDCDGVLTDGGVYYNDVGEAMKRFNIRDGMGVERLRTIADIETGIITGENSFPVLNRAMKLKIIELHQGIKDKPAVLQKILQQKKLHADEVAYIGDDTNDVEIMKLVGLSACPADALSFAQNAAHYICEKKGGEGAFREFAELIIAAKV